MERTKMTEIQELREALKRNKAELQQKNRELEIEAAIEKVRKVALSLKKSEHMLDIAQVLYEQLLQLGFTDIRNALIDIHDEKTESFLDYDYSELMGGTVTHMTYEDDPTLKEQVQDIAKTTDGFSEMVLEGQQLQDLIDMRKRNGEADDPRLHSATSICYILYAFGNGAIGISNFGKLTENQKAILDRFRNVFTFAYNRYYELAKAESQMREIQLESALEKVRSVALSMQQPNDMLDVAKVLYEQLRELGFTDIRNAIIDLHNEDNETFWDYDYSEEMSGTITLLSYKNDPTLEEQYRKIIATTNGFYEEIYEGDDLKEYVEMRIRNGEKEDPRLRGINLLSYYLYSFGNGVIGISNFSILTENQKNIVSRFRNVFTFAYQRYKYLVQSEIDVKNLEIAKKKAEKALLDLQATQAQLIQSEKMASLGVLTAGIAHEIKNPLNFVNNFSELNLELIDEVFTELQKTTDSPEKEEITAILNDVIGNQKKIYEHGTRADSIVKSMLLHSRGGKGIKEITSINDMLKEYVNLAFHGMRAGKKPMNVTLDFQLDASLPDVSIIIEDMSRAILNLCNNAFDAMYERLKNSNEDTYQPRLGITSYHKKKAVFIAIQDNGLGISEALQDKILMPFFTTKRGTEGTGLGLSITNDIIKAHGGSLTIESSEGNNSFTTFTIKLPI